MQVTLFQVKNTAADGDGGRLQLHFGNSDVAMDVDFFVHGTTNSKIDASVVCAGWMVPPTDIASPILTVHEAKHNMSFRDGTIEYTVPYLAMPKSDDDASDTPVLVKVINGKAFAVLMRSHLSSTQRVLGMRQVWFSRSLHRLNRACVCVLVILLILLLGLQGLERNGAQKKESSAHTRAMLMHMIRISGHPVMHRYRLSV